MSNKVSAHASVRFFHKTLDPIDVTRLLKLPPDSMYRAGEPKLIRTTKGKIIEGPDWTSGFWTISSKLWVDSPKLKVHIEWLLNELEPKAEGIAQLLEQGINADFFCYSIGPNIDPPDIPKMLHQRADKLGLRIDIDHYRFDETSASV